MLNGTIYKITCLVNQKCYIGQTFQPVEKRWSAHERGHGNEPLFDDIRKHGSEQFKFEILHHGITSAELLNELETLMIAAHDSVKNGYNVNCKQGGPPLSDLWDHAEKICFLYTNEHKSLGQLAEQFDTNKTMIHIILRANKIKIRRKSYAWEYAEVIHYYYTKKRIKLTHIAKIYGVNPGTIRKILKAKGVIFKTLKRKKIIPVENFREFIVYLYSEKQMSTAEIAKRFSESIETILGILQNASQPSKHEG